ncbi:MAG: glycosyltransferase family 4 protein [Haliscomenobacter sp.]|nr:glycosyltransferase family 4 protein [Haliscomenobacter sp.]
MRIAINTRFLLPGKLEGIGWYTYEVCRRLVEQHPEDEFIFLFDRPFDKRFLFGPNVRGVLVPPPARHPVLWYLWFEWAVPAALKTLKPDVFFSPDGYMSRTVGTPSVMVLHDLAYIHYPEQLPKPVLRYLTRYTQKFLARSDRIIAISHFVKSDILRHFPLEEARIAVAPNGCREGFVPLGHAEQQQVRNHYAGGDPYFFYLGALHPRKNIPRLIEAYSRFREETGANVKLLVGGRMAWKTGAIFDAWTQSAFRDDVLFLGYLPEEELKKVTASALALTYLSLFEGFGLPILEAMHCDVPVITSAAASMPEVAGDAALLVDPKQVDQIAGAMTEVWRKPELRESLIARGRTQREWFSWDTAAQKIYTVLEQAGNKKSARG